MFDMSQTSVRERGMAARRPLTGTYLAFRLGDGEYAVEIDKVVEVFQTNHIVQAPTEPSCVRGFVNVHGRAVPLVDLHGKPGGGLAVADVADGCVIVINLSDGPVWSLTSILVDSVAGIIEIEDAETESSWQAPEHFGEEQILGTATTGGTRRILLDIEAALACTEEACLCRA